MNKKRLLAIITLCLVVAISMPMLYLNMSGGDNTQQAYAALVGAGTASVLNLNEKGVAQDYFSNVITGGQNEYIYFGNNVSSTTANTPGYLNTMHTGAIKWRVLSTTDTKYNSNGGSWLLWADYRVGCGYYNPNTKSPYYSFWSNSMLRAKFNGGTYQSTVSNNSTKPSLNQTVAPADSWLYSIFNVNERASFVATTSYDTWCSIYYNNSGYYPTKNIVGTTGNVYSTTIVNNAISNGASVSIVDTSVRETTSGDYLFLIDYDDINNTLFGFGDNGIVYAKKRIPTWTSSKEDGYYLSEWGNQTVTYVDYLQEPTDIGGDYYFLRPAQIYQNKQASAVGVNSTDGGCDPLYMDEDGGPLGIRPAFNFSPANVIYATAASVSSNGSTFAQVDSYVDKPAYKVYLKSSGYRNFSVGTYSDMPKLTTGGSTVSIEKSGQSGSAVFLLADKSGNGEVKYQATANFTGGVATATLPSGVKASDYVVTVLFLDGTARGGEYAEVVTASYTNMTVPEDKATTNVQYYSGSDLNFKLSYVDLDMLDVSVSAYLGLNGVTAVPTTVSTSASNGELTFTAREVGKYTITVTPKSGYYWVDGTTTPKDYIFFIKHKVTELVFSENSSNTITKTYDKTEQSFAITGYDKDLVDIKASTVADLTFDGNASPPVFKVTKAKTYNVAVDLKDTTLMEWSTVGDTSSKSLTVVMEKQKIVKPALTNSADSSKPFVSSTTPVSFALTNMSGYSSGDVEIDAPTSPSGASVDSTALKAISVGTYSFTVRLKDADNTEWSDSSGALSYTITVTVTKKDVAIPSFASGADKKTYNGSAQTFTLTMDTTAIEIRDTENNVVTAFEEKDADTYIYKLYLKDTQNTQWQGTSGDTAPRDISFTIDKKTLNITSITCSENGNPPSWEKGKADVTFTIVEDSLAGDVVKLKIYREQSGTKAYDLTNVDESTAKTVIVTMPDYLPQGSYILGVELADAAADNANKNYVLTTTQSQIRKTFVVRGQGLILSEDNMPWIYKYTDKDGIENTIHILVDPAVKARKAELTYTGYEYTFSVDTDELAALGAEIDTSKGTNGFSGDVKYTNATTSSRTVTVYWKPMAGYEGNGGSYTLTYDIQKAKYDLTNTKWDYTTPKDYNPLQTYTVKIIDLPDGLELTDADYQNNRYKPAGKYEAQVVSIQNNNSNYITPSFTDKDSYIYGGNEFPWTLNWEIVPQKLNLTWVAKNSDNNEFVYYVVSGDDAERIDSYLYYKDGDYDNSTGVATGTPIALSDIVVPNKAIQAYWAVAVLKDSNNYEIESNKARRFTVGSLKEIVKIEFRESQPFEYDGNPHGQEINVITSDNTLTSSNIDTKYYKDSVSDANLLSEAPKDAGKYILVVSLKSGLESDYEITVNTLDFEIVKAKIVATWDKDGAMPKIADESKYKDVIGYIYYDADGNQLDDGVELEVGKTYSVKAILKGNYGDNYEFVGEDGVTLLDDPTTTDEEEFVLKEKPVNGSGNEVGIGSGTQSGNQGGATGGTLDEILEKLKEIPLWQLIAGVISIILIIIFMAKTAGYESKRKKFNKKADKLESGMYATAPFLGLAVSGWTAIACVLMGLAVASFAIMIIAKSRCNKAEDNYEDCLAEAEHRRKDEEKEEARQREENMRMMLMGVMGGTNGSNQGGYFMQQGLGADEIRGIVTETMTAMLPGMQQMLPQQASSNDEAVNKLIEQNEKLMKKLGEQTKVVEKEIAVASSSNDEIVKSLLEEQKEMRSIVKRLAEQPIQKEVVATIADDETIKQMLRNQEQLMQKVLELSSSKEPQIIEKEVIKEVPVEKIVEVPVEVEKIVEKEVKVEVPVEKVIEKEIIKEVPVEVEKIVEKEVKVEVPVEKIVEKEIVKEVKVEVPVVAPTPAKPKKETAPRLTLDEAYALLSKQQQKYFDGLREYALTKDKCKEKKSTYFVVFGQSSVNPLMKLTIKKGKTVALFKMEDEYLKDIKRDATSDGTKVKVKETEVVIADAQSCKVAKNMIDLREDQIERYQELLKEQRAVGKKK